MARARRDSPGIRNKFWGGGIFAAPATLTATQQILATLLANSVATRTLLRCRGALYVDGISDAAGDVATVGLGIIVVQQAAAAVGGTSIPGPIGDIDADWLWHKFVNLHSNEVSAVSDTALGLNQIVEVDSKAMRIVKSDQSIILVGETTGQTLASVHASGGVRVLIGEH